MTIIVIIDADPILFMSLLATPSSNPPVGSVSFLTLQA